MSAETNLQTVDGLGRDKESERLRSLRQTKLLDTSDDPRFDAFTRLATKFFNVPMSTVSFLDDRREWFKSAIGLPQGMSHPRELSFCTHAIERPGQILVVEDAAQDMRFAAYPFVTEEPGIRFYAGAAILDEDGRALGTLCVLDTKPREMTSEERSLLSDLAFGVSSIVRMEQAIQAWHESEENYRWAVTLSPQIPWTADADGMILTVGPRFSEHLGIAAEDVLGKGWLNFTFSEDRAFSAAAWAKAVADGTPLDIKFRFNLKDGTRRWFRSRASPRFGESGALVRWYGVIEDIHDAKLAELTLKRTADRLDNVLESTTDLVTFYDLDWRVLYMNRRLMRIPAFASAMGRVLWDALPYLRGTEWEIQLRRAQATKVPTTFEWFSPGLRYWIEVTAYPASDGLSVFSRNIQERHLLANTRREAEAASAHQARHDTLTKLPNRAFLQERVGDVLSGMASDDALALVHIGLDNFKQVNSTLGPAAGDELLRLAAERLTGVVAAGDLLGRLGGDIFAVVQSGSLQPDRAIRLAKDAIAALSQPFEIDASRITVGASVGIALAPSDDLNGDHLLQAADIALYHAKEEGGGAWASFAPQMQKDLRIRQELRIGLRDGLERNEFTLVYQPLIDLPSKVIGGFEALIRWQHPTRGFVSPAEFISVAEDSGIIVSLGLWALRAACLEASKWPAPIRVAVNLSPVQFKDPGLVQSVAAILEETGFPPQRLKLEITETVLLQDSSSNLATLHALHHLGILIVLDDFGTGYSSLGYLQKFPFDKLKIDQSFIRHIPEEIQSQQIVRSILSLANALQIGTTAEGVEKPSQLDWLQAAGCGQIQGYLFSKPMPSDEVLSYIAKYHFGNVKDGPNA